MWTGKSPAGVLSANAPGELETDLRNHDQLAENPRVHFHFTPIGSSWINQIETGFAVITRQAIRRGTFTSVKMLIKQIRDYIEHWNTDAEPFTWIATANKRRSDVPADICHVGCPFTTAPPWRRGGDAVEGSGLI